MVRRRCGFHNRVVSVPAIRIAVIDDYPLVRAGVIALIGAHPDLTVVGEAGCGEEGWRVVATTGADLVLLDLNMPGVDGFEFLRRLPDTSRPVVLVLAAAVDDEVIRDVVRLGGSGVIDKTALSTELVDAIRTVSSGRGWIHGRAVDDPRAAVASLLPPPVAAASAMRLTARQLDVADGVARGWSNRDIAAALRISEDTVKRHLTHIFARLGVETRLELAMLARRREDSQGDGHA